MYKERINDDEVTKLFKEIVKKENEKHGLDIDFLYVSFNDRFISIINSLDICLEYNEDKKIAREIYRTLCFTTACYSPVTSSISFIGEKKYRKYREDTYDKLYIVTTAYHEFFHALNDLKIKGVKKGFFDIQDITFELFFSAMENKIFKEDEIITEYRNNHDGFIEEIQANLYGIEQVIKNYNLSDKDLKKLSKEKKKNLRLYENYDTNFFINNFYKYYKMGAIELDLDLSNTIFGIFFSDGDYRNINEIIKECTNIKIDSRIIKAIILSDSFKDKIMSIDYSLDDDTIIYIIDILDDEIIRLNKKIKQKKQFKSIESIKYYNNKLFLLNDEGIHLISELPLVGKCFIKPLVKYTEKLFDFNEDELKKHYNDKDEERLKFVNQLYKELIKKYNLQEELYDKKM